VIRHARELEPGDQIVWDRRTWVITMVWIAPGGIVVVDVADGELFGTVRLGAFQPVQCA